MRAFLTLTLAALLSACGNRITTLNPTPVRFTTFNVRGGTIDPSHSCTPPTPPAPADPTAPGSADVLVGYQDWRNTVADASGQCQTSNAKRWLGVVTFDMSPVVNDIAAAPFKTLTGTLSFDPVTQPQVGNQLQICALRLDMMTPVPTSGGVVPLNFLTGQNFPATAAPSLGMLPLPASAPFNQITHHGSVTVDGNPPFPTITADVSLMLSDWAGSRPPSLAVAFIPRGPTLAALGIASGTPVPVNRNVQCVTSVRRVSLTVNVGR
jgi:hypothetical protein